MDQKKQEVPPQSNFKEIREFAHDIYTYIWNRQKFHNQEIFKKTGENWCYSTGLVETEISTENIGNAVRVTQFLLRDYFGHFFKFIIAEKRDFKKEAKLLWSHWINHRPDIYVKVIDTMAIIADAFLFCDYSNNSEMKLNDVSKWFLEWFQERLEYDFFSRGGYNIFNRNSLGWYTDMFRNLNRYMKMPYNPYHSESVTNMYSHACDVVLFLLSSPVKFPVPESMLCDSCRHAVDESLYRKTIYIRLANEIKEKIILKRTDSIIYLPRKTKSITDKSNDAIKDSNIPSKHVAPEEISTTVPSPAIQQLQFKEVGKDSNKHISKDISNIKLINIISVLSQHFNKDKLQDFKPGVEHTSGEYIRKALVRLSISAKLSQSENSEIYSEQLSTTMGSNKDTSKDISNVKLITFISALYKTVTDKIPLQNFKPGVEDALSEYLRKAFIRLSINSKLSQSKETENKDNLSANKIPTKRENSKSEQNLYLNQAVPYIQEEFKKHTDEEKVVSASSEIEVPFTNSSENFELNSVKETSKTKKPREVEHQTSSQVAELPGNMLAKNMTASEFEYEETELPGNTLAENMTASEFDNYLEKMYNKPKSFPTKQRSVIPRTRPIKHAFHLLRLCFHKSEPFKVCLQELQQTVGSIDCQIELSSKQNIFHFVSDKYSNSFEKLFKDNLCPPPVTKFKGSKNSEVPIAQNVKTVENPNFSDDFFLLEIVICEYQYYLIGEVKLPQTTKKIRNKKLNIL